MGPIIGIYVSVACDSLLHIATLFRYEMCTVCLFKAIITWKYFLYSTVLFPNIFFFISGSNTTVNRQFFMFLFIICCITLVLNSNLYLLHYIVMYFYDTFTQFPISGFIGLLGKKIKTLWILWNRILVISPWISSNDILTSPFAITIQYFLGELPFAAVREYTRYSNERQIQISWDSSLSFVYWSWYFS